MCGIEETQVAMIRFTFFTINQYTTIITVTSTRYDTAVNEAESPVITWVQVLGSYLQYLRGVS